MVKLGRGGGSGFALAHEGPMVWIGPVLNPPPSQRAGRVRMSSSARLSAVRGQHGSARRREGARCASVRMGPAGISGRRKRDDSDGPGRAERTNVPAALAILQIVPAPC